MLFKRKITREFNNKFGKMYSFNEKTRVYKKTNETEKCRQEI